MDDQPWKVRINDGALVELDLHGEFDADESVRLGAALQAFALASREIRLDLSAVTFLGSQGLAALVRGHLAAREAGGTLVVTAASDIVRRVIEMADLGALLYGPGRAGGAPD